MEESKALSKLSEVSDLLMLLEDVLNPTSVSRLSPSSWSGLRITLRNARVSLHESQSALTKEFANRARAKSPLSAISSDQVINNLTEKGTFIPSTIATVGNGSLVSNQQDSAQLSSEASLDRNANETSRVQITRRDLKATLEKFIESR